MTDADVKELAEKLAEMSNKFSEEELLFLASQIADKLATTQEVPMGAGDYLADDNVRATVDQLQDLPGGFYSVGSLHSPLRLNEPNRGSDHTGNDEKEVNQ